MSRSWTNRPYLSPREVCGILKINETELKRLVRLGKIDKFVFDGRTEGGKEQYMPSNIMNYIKNQDT